MSKLINEDFRIISILKNVIINTDDLLENVPRKDLYFKDLIKEKLMNIMEIIYYVNNIDDKNIIKLKLADVKTNIYLIDFLLERLYKKRYISEKSMDKVVLGLINIMKMFTSLVNNKIDGKN